LKICFLDNEWLQFDLGPPTQITGLVTKGQGNRRCFVTSYTLSYSNDTSVWFFYKDVNHFEPKIFGGNMDKNTERRHYLNAPGIFSKKFTFYPLLTPFFVEPIILELFSFKCHRISTKYPKYILSYCKKL
jgi:hypothetical protein